MSQYQFPQNKLPTAGLEYGVRLVRERDYTIAAPQITCPADTPLFSGTCLRADKVVFKPQVIPTAEAFTCATCRDTGELNGRPCLCRLVGLMEMSNA